MPFLPPTASLPEGWPPLAFVSTNSAPRMPIPLLPQPSHAHPVRSVPNVTAFIKTCLVFHQGRQERPSGPPSSELAISPPTPFSATWYTRPGPGLVPTRDRWKEVVGKLRAGTWGRSGHLRPTFPRLLPDPPSPQRSLRAQGVTRLGRTDFGVPCPWPHSICFFSS